MKKIYQQEVSSSNGDCMRAVAATILGLELEEVPHFIANKEPGIWWHSYRAFFKYHGYYHVNTFYNRANQIFRTYKKGSKFQEESTLNLDVLKQYRGVNGLFYGTVYSPKYSKINDRDHYHAVVVDSDMNIVHDPNLGYKDLIKYPLQDIIGLNGITELDVFEKINLL